MHSDAGDEMGEVAVVDLAVALRTHFGLPPYEPSPRRDLPDQVRADLSARVDLRLLIAWSALGLHLLAAPRTMKEMLDEVRRFATLAGLRAVGGNRPVASKTMGVNRLRISRALGLHRLPAAGTRIVAIESVTEHVVYVYGHGCAAGKGRPPDGTCTRIGVVGERWPRQFVVARLELDDGTIMWGPQCTWMTEAEFAAEHGHREERIVPPP